MNLKFLLSSISMAIAAGAASAATVHVRANAAAPAAPYDSWANACGDVATAVSYAAANGADTVLVTNGTYSLSSTISIADAITLRSVEGAGATILDGQGQVRALAVNHAGAVVSGFTVTNGWAAAGGHGGGILVGHGTVERCVVTGCTTADGYGGGIRIDNGLVDGCVVTRCLAGGASGNGGAGGGIAVFGGTVRSCLVAANECTGVQGHIGGGGIIAMTTASTIENCTIVRNYDRETFSTDGCGGLYISYGGVSPTIRNCIIRDNEAAGSNDNHDWFVYPGSTYAASFNNVPVALGTDAIPGDPLFVSAGSGCGLNADPGDCHFPFRSPCARTASLQPWMAAARDADGLPRIAPTTTHPDLGAFTVTVEDFECAFSASPGRGMVPLDVSFRSWVDVADIGHAQLTYRWDFNNDGSYESEGASSTAEWNYTVPGTFSPRLRVENAATGKWCEYVATNGVVAAPNTLYVSPDGSETPPYDTLQTATHSLSNALAAAADGMVILVDSGVYPLDATVHVSLGVTIRSLDRTNPAVLDGQGARRCMTLSHASAVLDGLVISNGYSSVEQDTGCGVQLIDGTVRDCTITSCNGVGSHGTGIYAKNGLVYRTRIVGNRTSGTYSAGGGAYIEGAATLRGCLITDNYCSGRQGHLGGGGVYLFNGGIIENCTIVGNTDVAETDNDGGGGLYFFNSSGVSYVTNSILYGNTVQNCGTGPEWYNRMGTVSAGFNCTPQALGSDCITKAPVFADAANGDYSLQPESACAFAGANLAWMEGETDIAGNPRIDALVGRADIGAYACVAEEALMCFYTASYTPRTIVPVEVSFEARCVGTATNSLAYYWDFDGDGATDLSGTDCATPKHVYTKAGVFSPVLVVTNSSPFAEAAAVVADCVTVSPAIVYVATDGAGVAPYDMPAKAASTVAAALTVAGVGSEISVAAGRYAISSPILLEEEITLRGAGAEATLLDGGNATRVLEINHANAVCEGMSLVNGRVQGGGGGGAMLYAGTLRGCIVSNCYVESAHNGSNGGGGLMFPQDSTAIAENCTIVRNTATAVGGGVYLHTTGVLRNCLIAANDCGGGEGHVGGGGVSSYYGGATLDNCTIVGNHDGGSGEGGGFYHFFNNSTLANCLLYGNTRADAAADVYNWTGNSTGTTVDHCFVGTGYGDALSGDPLLADVGGTPGLNYNFADCRPVRSSPCVNSGTLLSWMDGATDLDGNKRVVGRPDMGCYEFHAFGTVFLLR
ncbi:MAG: hypothetical protein ACOX5G_08795 [Kiritimatiellia bacterium]